MFLGTPSTRLLLFAFYLLIFDFCCAYPTPYSYKSTIFPRQESQLSLPATVTLTERITTGIEVFIQTCTITLTPIVTNGVDLVREEKQCVITPDNGSGDVPGAPPPPASTPTVLPSSTDVPPNTVPPEPTNTGLPPASSVAVPPPVISITLTSIPLPAPSSSMSSSSSSTSTSTVVVPSPSPPVVVIGTSSVPNPVATPQPDTIPSHNDTSPGSSSLSSPPTPAAENAGAPTGAFDPPGKKLEVLPIGLGVFAGISVIGLFVVGIVTWERTKHRRNFRKLKLQEAGNRMGYGTAQG